LGQSISYLIQQDGLAEIDTLLNSTFDSGYYAAIVVDTHDGQVLGERRRDVVIQQVPAFFIDLLTLTAPTRASVVMDGWRELGKVTVTSHPGYAYASLWAGTLYLLGWFGAIAVLLALLGMAVLRVLLKPLHDVEKQAEAVAERRFDVQLALPRTRELRAVVEAMNRMTLKVQAQFDEQSRSAERLREMAFGDPVTGLTNRRFLESQLQARLAADAAGEPAAVLLVHLEGLQEINDKQGFAAGDRLLKAAAEVLRQATAEFDSPVLAHLSGADFGVLLPQVALADAERCATLLCEQLPALREQGLTAEADVVHVGVTLLHGAKHLGEVLGTADLALRGAQAAGPNGWKTQLRDSTREAGIMGRSEWHKLLRDSIDREQVLVYAQPVSALDAGTALLHREILVRLPDHEGRPLAAGLFMPMAEELGLTHELDLVILQAVLRELRSQPADTAFAINISASSLRDAALVEWLLGELAAWSASAPRLFFELSESGVLRAPDAARALVQALRARRVGFGLDHFGQGFSAFGYLKTLRPDYVKIDGGYSAKLAEDFDNQFFVETLVGVAHSLDIRCIAEMVEDETQRDLLRQLGADGIQGYLVGRPEPLHG
ncbi:MAG TPA: EAL domain-containing protein, partial [Gammaproteobacteria bacterium]